MDLQFTKNQEDATLDFGHSLLPPQSVRFRCTQSIQHQKREMSDNGFGEMWNHMVRYGKALFMRC